MEVLAGTAYYSDEMDHGSIFDQWELTVFDQLEMPMERDLEKSPSSECYSATTTTSSYPSAHPPAVVGAAAPVGRPRKMARTAASSWSSSCTADALLPADVASGPKILSFGGGGGGGSSGNHAAEYSAADFYAAKPKEEIDVVVPAVAKRSRSASHNQEHIMAERKRREKLSQRFIALSAIVPGLKKMDKASVLGDATKYLKQLQERVKSLEEQAAKRSEESVVLVMKSRLCASEDGGDDDTTDESCFDESGRGQMSMLPEIEARVCERAVLIKIHCENQKAVLVKTLSEIEKLHLSVCNTSVIPFTSSSLDITVMTQMEEGFSMTARDLVKKLNSAFRRITQ